MLDRLARAALLAAGGAIGVLAPVSLTPSSGLKAAAAECATCCPQQGATCVVCGTEECVAHPGYYQGKAGPNPCDAAVT